jgi:ABC-type Fe3+ transport system substrate-binding protein
MRASTIIIGLCLAVLLGVPVAFRPADENVLGEVENASGQMPLELIIITPHNEQIRDEFGRAFDDWHRRTYGRAVNVIYSVPGGTTEIRKMLESQFSAALENEKSPGGNADLVFGGGSFEHGRLKRGVLVVENGHERWEPITTPGAFSDEFLARTYGVNQIGEDPLYDPDKHWFGLALSGFGIVFNRDALDEIGRVEPETWIDICDPALRGRVALVNPSQSGSITTAFEAILKRYGWIEGWRILRRMGANARYCSAASLKPPIDVSQGNAAVGICIDFLGRFQAQALREAGDPDRLGYIDPRGGTTIDADPISMLRNAPHPETAKRFIEFCLTDEGQALWQFPRRIANSTDRLGPERYELRRMPVRRAVYEKYADRFVDRVNPFEMVTPIQHSNPNFRDFIAPMFAAMVMDTDASLKRAWESIVSHPSYPSGQGIVIAADVNDPQLRNVLEVFDALPSVNGPGGEVLSLEDVNNLGTIRQGWLRGGWKNQGLWNSQSTGPEAMRREFVRFFRGHYRRVNEIVEASDR